MLTNEERIRALICNLRNWDWSVLPQFRLEKEDGEALLRMLSRDSGSVKENTQEGETTE